MSAEPSCSPSVLLSNLAPDLPENYLAATAVFHHSPGLPQFERRERRPSVGVVRPGEVRRPGS